jgi:hypothetical protein
LIPSCRDSRDKTTAVFDFTWRKKNTTITKLILGAKKTRERTTTYMPNWNSNQDTKTLLEKLEREMTMTKQEANRELLEKAKRLTQRQADGSFIEAELVANLQSLITIDADAEKRRLAKTIIDSEKFRR